MLGRAYKYQLVDYLIFFAISVTSFFKFFLCELLSKRSSW